MSMPVPPSDPKAVEAKPHPAENFAEDLQLFWFKNRNAILIGCTIILASIVARGGWAFYVEQREANVTKEYAAASTTEKLKKFATENEGHLLSGVALLRLADEAHAAAKYSEALATYEKAKPVLKGTAFASRAALGAAMSQVLGGKLAEGKAALISLAGDAAEFKGIRAEAAYHLASIANEAGKPEDASKFIDQVLQVDSSGMWARRAIMLRASLPIPAAVPQAKPAEAASAASPEVKLTVPGK